jgi:hypothetical protein
VAKFYTLEGYNKNGTLQKYKVNPDKSPVYYNDYELGSWLSAALKLPPLSMNSFAAMLPSLPPISIPPISFPSLPSLPPLPSFSLPNIFPPIPTPVLSVPSLPSVNMQIPNISASLPKIDIPSINITPPLIKIEPQIPKIDLRPSPIKVKVNAEEIGKTGESVTAVGTATTIVGKGMVEVGGAIASTGALVKVGGFIAGAGATVITAGAGITAVGAGITAAASTLQTAQGIIANKDIIGGLKLIGETSDKVGIKEISQTTNTAVNTITQAQNTVTQVQTQTQNAINQAQNIANTFQSSNPQQSLNSVNNLLNQSGVSPQVTDRISQGGQMLQTGQSFLSTSPYKDEIFKLQSLNINKDPNTIVKPLQPIFKDPVNDPTHPLYIPPPPSSEKIPSSKPINLPSNTILEKQKSDMNIGIFLIAGLGFYLFTQNKKGKRK